MKKKIVSVVVAAALASFTALGVSACGGSSGGSSSGGQQQQQQAEPTYIDSVDENDKYASGTHHVKVTVEGFKPFTIALDADSAPISVSNFCHLVEDGFYNGLTFHRVVDEFCLQGGDPSGDGTGGSDQKIKGEFSGNGVANKLADSFKRGTVSMARNSSSMNSAATAFVTDIHRKLSVRQDDSDHSGGLPIELCVHPCLLRSCHPFKGLHR